MTPGDIPPVRRVLSHPITAVRQWALIWSWILKLVLWLKPGCPISGSLVLRVRLISLDFVHWVPSCLCFFFFLADLLGYNLPTIKVTHSRYKIQLCLVYLQSCTTTITIWFQNIVITPERNSYLVIPYSHSQPQATSDILSVSLLLSILDIS